MDSSAVAKLVLLEDESEALEDAVRGCRLVGSSLLRVELARAVRRHRQGPDLLPVVGRVVDRMDLVPVDAATLTLASNVNPVVLRTLDAIHLASALVVRADLDAFITYDRQLADAASAAGLAVEAPA